MDPNTSTRQEFTTHLLTHPIPPTASYPWKTSATLNKSLLSKLTSHPAMSPDLQQTYNTPANSKNKIYFMWDFVGRTLGLLYQIPAEMTPETARGEGEKAAWRDVVGRQMMAASLILDEQRGMLDMMVARASSGEPVPELDEETVEIARRLKG